MERVSWRYILSVRDQDVGKEPEYWHSEDLGSSSCSTLYQLCDLGVEGGHLSLSPEKLRELMLSCDLPRIMWTV